MASDIPNRGPELLAVNISFLTASLISIILRCYVRIFMVKAFGIDDWLMAFGAVFFTLNATFSSVGVSYGTGRHHADLEPDQISTAMMYWWFCYLWYCLAMISSKISIGWFLLRVTISRVHSWIIYIAMGSTALSGAMLFFITLFQCRPISFFWTRAEPGRCISADIVVIIATLYSVTAVISDFIFALLPAVIIWKLQLDMKTKLMLIPLLAMGCIASSAVVARFSYLPKLKEVDFLWNTVDVAIWSNVEQGLAITAGSLATLRPLLKLIAYKLSLTSKPISGPPSNHGTSSRYPPRSIPNGYFSRGDAYSLSSISRDGVVDRENIGNRAIKPGLSPSTFKADVKTEIQVTSVRRSGPNASEEELNSMRTWATRPV